MSKYNDLVEKHSTLAVIGLGYVGLPIALAFAKKIHVVGFDINKDRVTLLNKNIDPSKELDSSEFEGAAIEFTSSIDVLKKASFFIVAVPTPVDEHHVPNLKPIIAATQSVAKVLKKGDYVVYESTVYPGCTEEDCLPLLEKGSGLQVGTDFKLGYSPERINPGDKEHTLSKIVKIVSGNDTEALDVITRVYELVVEAGVHKASSIKVAEAAKIIENTQRDLNIALMNELSLIFDRMGVNTYEVLEAAGTKWNFLKFQPGLVGGHCIGVDPYYLTHKANELGYTCEVILAGRSINDNMAQYVAGKVVQHILGVNDNIRSARVLIMGATFKENVSDIRNSKIVDMVSSLKSYHIQVDVTDPYASSQEVAEEYGFSLINEPQGLYDAIIIAVPHDSYKNFTDASLALLTKEAGMIADLKGMYRNKITSRKYWSL